MKKLMVLALCGGMFNQAMAQEKCATTRLLQQQIDAHPGYAAMRAHYREHSIEQAAFYTKSKAQMKTTQNEKIPVVFHVILNTPAMNFLGGNNGIIQRAMDQISVLNEDFNALNADKTKIPAAFAGLQGTAGFTFGLAHRKPDGTSTSGVEILNTTTTSFAAGTNGGSLPKSTTTNGLDPWDPNRYLNIWIVNITENGILGYTIPPSFVNFGYTIQEIGVVIDYGAFGKRGGSIQNFTPTTNDRGRTTTHEVGHFFELEHIFGGGAGCPGSGDYDDGIADTPPQNDATYNSSFSGSTIPFPLTDACTPSAPGIMWMNFMDYPDDTSMYLFSQGQVNYMRSKMGSGVLNSLTLHPELLDWPTAVASVTPEKEISVYPNPTTGRITISIGNNERLNQIDVVNVVGTVVRSIKVSDLAISNYDIDLSGISKGVYMVRCTFADGTITKKIVLQ